MIDNRVFDRHGNLFVAIVSWDFDYGWICEAWNDGEYEQDSIGLYGDCELCRRAAFDEGLEIAKRRGGRVLHYYEFPSDISRRRSSYPVIDEVDFLCDCDCSIFRACGRGGSVSDIIRCEGCHTEITDPDSRFCDACEDEVMNYSTKEHIDRLTRENAELRENLAGAEKELDDVAGRVDDILFDPYFNPVDNAGNPIRGKDIYMTDHEIQYDHLPSLRAWFVKRSYKD